MTRTSPALVPGTLLGDDYVVHERMAAGGMGEVYAATHVRLPGRLAIKVLAPHLAAEPGAVARFCREAAIASVLRHPHVVQMLDFDVSTGDLPFLVMEHLEGQDLAQHLLLHGPLSLDRVVAIVGQIASALEVAHRLGIVHRDLKPANVMLLVAHEGQSDFVKVLDFGVSRIAGVESRHRGVMGTPSYMAPEQAEGLSDEVDARTDQFSLAVLGYVLLTGVPPFAGATTAEIFQNILFSEPDALGGRVPWSSSAVERVLGRALAKRASARFARVTDFADALAEAARTVGGAAARQPAPANFQGRSVANLYETLICVRPPGFCGASNGSSRSEDVTIDAVPRPIDASMAEVA